MAEQILTADHVSKVFYECLSCSGEDAKKVTGIVRHAFFSPPAIEAHKTEISEMLAELPDEFRTSGGGGWSFLQACTDRHGNLWTGLHKAMEELFMLGMAAGFVTELLSRDMWSALPGEMPYYAVNLE
jgi:hypothetical protein